MVRALDSRDGSCDLSNGVKYGQSTMYDASNYSESTIAKFRKMAAIDSFSESELDRQSGDCSSPVDVSGQQHSWVKNGESGSLAFNGR